MNWHLCKRRVARRQTPFSCGVTVVTRHLTPQAV
jgi:hypothetical protein